VTLRWLVCALFFSSLPVLWAQTPSRLLNEAEAASLQGQPDQALTLIDRFLDELKQGTVTGSRRAQQLDQAGKILSGLREKESQSVRAGYLLGEIRFLQNQFKEALEILNPLRSASLKDADYFNLVGMCLGGLNQLSEAAQVVITAITLAPQRPDLYFNLAGLYQKAGDNRGALEVLDRAISKGMATPEIYFALGLSYYNLGNFLSANASFSKAVKMRPEFGKAYFYLARCSNKLGNATKAMASYRKSIALNPNDFLAPLELGELLFSLQQNTAGTQWMEKAVHLNPNYSESHYQLGKAYSKLGKVAPAVTELERAIALNPDQDGAYQELARLYLKAGKKEQAESLLTALNDRKQKRKAQYEKKVSGGSSQKEP
jgi:tetratricopeptide (TPR) repeat protein